MNPKEYYSKYLADDNASDLSKFLVDQILMTQPTSALEFGCGTGKNLKLIRENENKYALSNTKLFGIDISLMNVIHCHIKSDLPFVAHGDEDWLPKIRNIDVCFTCSVLDHIEKVDDIIKEMQRISKYVFLAETNDVPDEYYYPHKYESYGFKKLDFKWVGNDGSTYYVWRWGISKGIPKYGEEGNSFGAHDDLGSSKGSF
jgi:ubiquinone/menaquinone biosynthesis C-methylase UbiE